MNSSGSTMPSRRSRSGAFRFTLMPLATKRGRRSQKGNRRPPRAFSTAMLVRDEMRKEITLRSYLFRGATTEAPNEDGEIEFLPASSNTRSHGDCHSQKPSTIASSFHDYRARLPERQMRQPKSRG